MVTMDITLVIQIINIIVLMFFLNKVLYKPVRGILKKRADKLAGMQDEISKFEKNTLLRQEEVDARMAKASGKAKAALDAARADAQAAGAAKIAEIKAASDAEKEKQMADVKQQIEGAAQELQGKLGSFAEQMAGKILGRAL
ncbi:MAG: hypothetical protein CSB24_05335 [Deltaproteobacteria bacterium]|nr:MAG: hypothetical protein CSB24_05335 [Deltaproteobacteria bacterium]